MFWASDCFKGTCDAGAVTGVMLAIAIVIALGLAIGWWRGRDDR